MTSSKLENAKLLKPLDYESLAKEDSKIPLSEML